MTTTPAPAPTTSEVEAKAFIYQKESGNNPTAVNPTSGACGLGQALPCSKLTSRCNIVDYHCQDIFFTQYMFSRFNSWNEAKAYWLCIGQCTNKLGTITKTSTWW